MMVISAQRIAKKIIDFKIKVSVLLMIIPYYIKRWTFYKVILILRIHKDGVAGRK